MSAGLTRLAPPEVRDRGISDPTKRTGVFPLFFKRKKITVRTFPARVSVVWVLLGARRTPAHLRAASHSLTAETSRLARQVVRALAASTAPIYNQKFQSKMIREQECIPVGCVPSAH